MYAAAYRSYSKWTTYRPSSKFCQDMTDVRAPARDTRAAILEVAGELFAEKGYDATSLREISERLAITKAALYSHFRSKDDIMRALLAPMDDIVSELLERLE